MSDKTDIQALTEQIQALNANMQQLSSDMKEMKSANAAKSTAQVIRPSDFSAKVSLIPAAILSFVFSAFGTALLIFAAIGVTNGWAGGIASVTVGIICSYFFTKYWYKNLARKPMVNIDIVQTQTS